MIFGPTARLLERIRSNMNMSARDWAKSTDLAVLYGLLEGWEEAPDAVAKQHNWPIDFVKALDVAWHTLKHGAAKARQVGVLIPYCPATGRVLMFWRRKGRERETGPAWEFAGGKCRAGERPEDAARRESQEEAGLELGGELEYVGTGRFLDFDYSETPREVIVHRFMVEVVEELEPQLPPDEVYESFMWIGATDVAAGTSTLSISDHISDAIRPMDVSFLHCVFTMAETKRRIAEMIDRRTNPCIQCGGAPAAENCTCLPF